MEMKIEHKPVNALTVDVEDYYQVEAFAEIIPIEDWSQWEPRVERNTERILELFTRCNVRGTFFILGWVAEHHPQIVRKIAQSGHEIACHSFHHRLIRNQNREEFRDDLRRAKSRLEEITGKEVEGYRAPTYSITLQTLWALDILIEEGFRYDSSIFPIYHDRYGIPEAKRFPHIIRRECGEIIEFPPSTVRLFNQNFPIAGGGYFRVMPYPAFRWGLERINRSEGQSAIFMVHAWEVDPGQPVIPADRFRTWRHRNNLHRTLPRLEQLLRDFRFAPVRDVLQLGDAAAAVADSNLVGFDPVYAPAE
jgi:polysaccharide deacetylase family protein (PEP-CTERM system associated)